MGELLKLEPIKESSHSPPSARRSPNPTSSPGSSLHSPDLTGLSSLREAERGKGMRDCFKSPTGVLASDLSRTLSIKSPSSQRPKLTALPKHMQVAQPGRSGSKVCKTSSLLTSAMRFQSGNDGLNSILDGSPDPIPGILIYSVHVCEFVKPISYHLYASLVLTKVNSKHRWESNPHTSSHLRVCD